MKIKVLCSFMCGNKIAQPGDVIEVDDLAGINYIRHKAAISLDEVNDEKSNTILTNSDNSDTNTSDGDGNNSVTEENEEESNENITETENTSDGHKSTKTIEEMDRAELEQYLTTNNVSFSKDDAEKYLRKLARQIGK